MSIALPPPIARIKSIFSLRHISIPLRTRLSLGFGFTPPNSRISIFCCFNELLTASKSPFFLIRSEPYTTSTLLQSLYFRIFSPTCSCVPFPNTISVVLENSKLIIFLPVLICIILPFPKIQITPFSPGSPVLHH